MARAAPVSVEPSAGGSGTHSSDYLDGAPAVDAFQGLIDRGLFTDPAPAKAITAQAAPPQAPPVSAGPSSISPAAEATPPEANAAAATEPAGEDYASVDEYLTKVGVDRASFLELPITVKIDGKESQVPLAALVRSYQTDQHVTQRSQAQAAKEQAWVTEQAQAKQVFAQQFQTAQQLTNLAHQQLLADYQGVNWNQLRLENPQEWSAKQIEFNQRANAIQQQLQQVNALTQQQQAEAQQNQAQAVEAERNRMLEVFPEWRDPQKFQAARTELSSYAKQIGFNDAELAGIADHRYMKVLRDASLYAALQAKSPAVLKMVRAAPPMGAPGARTQRDPNTARFQQAKEQMRRNPRNEDAQIAAFSALADRGA